MNALRRASLLIHEPFIMRFSRVARSTMRLAIVAAAALVLLVTHRSADAQFTTGLSNHWTLNNTSGSTAINSVLGGVTGTIGFTSPGNIAIDQPGQVGRAYVLSGGTINSGSATNPRVTLSGSMIPATGQFTISGWIRSSAPGTSVNGSIFSNRTAAGGDSFNLSVAADGKLSLQAGWAGSGSGTTTLLTPSFVNTGDWVHVVASRNASSLVSLYVNGISEATQTRNGTILTSPTWYIGNRNSLITPFTGSLDDIATWTRALSNQEVALLGGLGYFAGVGVSDSSQLDAVLSVYQSGTGTALVGGQTWRYATGLGSSTIGMRGGSVAENSAFIVLGTDGSGVIIVPEPESVALAGIGIALAVRSLRRRK